MLYVMYTSSSSEEDESGALSPPKAKSRKQSGAAVQVYDHIFCLRVSHSQDFRKNSTIL